MSPHGHGPDVHEVFVSYASADRERVLGVVAQLEAAGVRVWVDQREIAGGTNYAAVIPDAIKRSKVVAVMCSAASLASKNVKREIGLAWDSFAEGRYLPLLLEPVALPDDLRYWLGGSQWVDAFSRPADVWLPDVLRALEGFGVSHNARPAAPAAGPRPPGPRAEARPAPPAAGDRRPAATPARPPVARPAPVSPRPAPVRAPPERSAGAPTTAGAPAMAGTPTTARAPPDAPPASDVATLRAALAGDCGPLADADPLQLCQSLARHDGLRVVAAALGAAAASGRPATGPEVAAAAGVVREVTGRLTWHAGRRAAARRDGDEPAGVDVLVIRTARALAALPGLPAADRDSLGLAAWLVESHTPAAVPQVGRVFSAAAGAELAAGAVAWPRPNSPGLAAGGRVLLVDSANRLGCLLLGGAEGDAGQVEWFGRLPGPAPTLALAPSKPAALVGTARRGVMLVRSLDGRPEAVTVADAPPLPGAMCLGLDGAGHDVLYAGDRSDVVAVPLGGLLDAAPAAGGPPAPLAWPGGRRTVLGHSGTVTCVAAPAFGRLVAAADTYGRVRLAGVETGTAGTPDVGRGPFDFGRPVNALSFSPAGDRLIVAGKHPDVVVVDTRTGAPVVRCPVPARFVTAAAFAWGGRALCAGGDNGVVCLFAAADGRLVWSSPVHRKPVLAVGFSPDGRWLASAAADGSVARVELTY